MSPQFRADQFPRTSFNRSMDHSLTLAEEEEIYQEQFALEKDDQPVFTCIFTRKDEEPYEEFLDGDPTNIFNSIKDLSHLELRKLYGEPYTVTCATCNNPEANCCVPNLLCSPCGCHSECECQSNDQIVEFFEEDDMLAHFPECAPLNYARDFDEPRPRTGGKIRGAKLNRAPKRQGSSGCRKVSHHD